jgi:hypothetical protein
LSDDEMRQRLAEGEWSLLEVCCHLRDAVNIGGVRIRRLLEEDNPTFEAGGRPAAAESAHQQEDPRAALMALRAFWSGLAYQLEGLSDADWERGGAQAERQVQHSAEHLEQMRAMRAAIRPA